MTLDQKYSRLSENCSFGEGIIFTSHGCFDHHNPRGLKIETAPLSPSGQEFGHTVVYGSAESLEVLGGVAVLLRLCRT